MSLSLKMTSSARSIPAFFGALVAVTVVAAMPSSLAATFNVKSYGAQGNGIANDESAIQATINAAIAAGAGNTVYIPAGNYLLGSDAASTAEEFDVFRANNLIIKGVSGSTLITPSSARNIFYFWADNGLTLTNLVLKRSVRKFTQMTVTSINQANNTIVATLMAGYDPPNSPNLAGSPLLLVYSNPSSKTWGDHQKDCGFFAPSSTSVCWPPTVTGTQQLSATQWRLTLNTSPQPNYVGAQAAMWVYGGGGSAIVSTASANVTIQNVAYYASGADSGFYLAGNSGPFTFNNFVMDVMPGTRDLVAASGGSYVYNNHTALTIKNSRIVAVWDDAVNVGANSARIFDVVNSNTIDVDGSKSAFNVGDTFGIWNWTYKGEYQRQQAIATAISCSSGTCRLTFDRAVTVGQTGHANSLPEDQDGIDRVIDITSAGSLTITGSTFQSLHARDVVFRPSNTVITGNIFENTIGPAIYTGFDFDCDEGPSSANNTITNNVFSDVSSSNILVGTEGDGATYSSVETDFSGNKIANNFFGGLGEFPQGPVGDPHAAVMLRAGATNLVTSNTYSPFTSTFTVVPQAVDAGSTTLATPESNVAITPGQYLSLLGSL